ncbi:MAG TPA: outer membrane beta-barrel domain-containing protein [Bdellovibrionota bacterium]|jgi:outer membrane beta-barrel protein|nr:outer membrane beta-barrel domain-containing protein [Bdellovibrionota bacterium]
MWAFLTLLLMLAPGSARAGDDEEYRFDWLDPDKKIYVLQNRRYEKVSRVLLSAMTGMGISNPYRNSWNVDVRGAYYITESVGIEGFFGLTSNTNNATFDALRAATTNILPLVREVQSQYGGLLHWAPWYAKINVFNSVLYFDWYFTAGAGITNSRFNHNSNPNLTASFVDESLFTFFAGTGHQYHLSRDLIVRLDFMGGFYNAPNDVSEKHKAWFSNYNVNIGVGLRL